MAIFIRDGGNHSVFLAQCPHTATRQYVSHCFHICHFGWLCFYINTTRRWILVYLTYLLTIEYIKDCIHKRIPIRLQCYMFLVPIRAYKCNFINVEWLTQLGYYSFIHCGWFILETLIECAKYSIKCDHEFITPWRKFIFLQKMPYFIIPSFIFYFNQEMVYSNGLLAYSNEKLTVFHVEGWTCPWDSV